MLSLSKSWQRLCRFLSLTQIYDEDGTFYLIGYHLQYECHNKLVNIVFLSSASPVDDEYFNSVKAEDKLLQKYDTATTSSQDGPDVESAVMEREEAVYQEIRDWVEELCRPTFLELAKTHVKRTSLFQYLHPEVVNVQIATQDDGELRVIRYSNDHPPWPDSVQQNSFTLTKSILPSSDLPSYSPKQITLVEVAGIQIVIPIVVVEEGGQIMCCKPCLFDSATETEYTKLKKIKDAGLDSLRVPSLRGLVTEEGGVIGLLMEFIEPSYSTLSAAMGEENAYYAPAVKPKKPAQDRKTKWARQIQQTVHQLHDIGVVWGDVKPDNILIDREDNAWVLDFGGGCTKGWVDKDLAETKEGDLQGLEKMLKYLGVVDDDESKA
jgi:tRNA A-37 threonylcarbamoyl transferase component Bud32